MNGDFFVAGLDLGQAGDHTALAILQIMAAASLVSADDELDVRLNRLQAQTRHLETSPDSLCGYALVGLERFPLGMSYPEQVSKVRQRMMTPELRERTMLIVDATGCGRPVLDLVRQTGLACDGVTIHGGGGVREVPGGFRVPKRDLVSVVQVVLHQGRLKFAKELPELATLKAELEKFRYKISPAGHDSYSAREGAHDDLVLALALACWWCECAPVVRTEIVDIHRPIGRW